MATKTISLTEGAYARLQALKREGESFSDVIDRLTGKFALLELVGILDEKAVRRLRAAKRDFGKRLREGTEAKALGEPMRLEYVGIRVTDLDRSVEFYTKQLGLEEVERRDDAGTPWGHGTWVLLRDVQTGHLLELNWYPPGSKYATPYTPGEGLDHIGFVVDDVASEFARLVGAGAEPALRPEETEGWLAFVKDPDGNWIEIQQLTAPGPREERSS